MCSGVIPPAYPPIPSKTAKNLQNQPKHHRRITFRDELEVFLKKHGLDYQERDLE
jgi:hypothetical protein